MYVIVLQEALVQESHIPAKYQPLHVITLICIVVT